MTPYHALLVRLAARFPRIRSALERTDRAVDRAVRNAQVLGWCGALALDLAQVGARRVRARLDQEYAAACFAYLLVRGLAVESCKQAIVDAAFEHDLRVALRGRR